MEVAMENIERDCRFGPSVGKGPFRVVWLRGPFGTLLGCSGGAPNFKTWKRSPTPVYPWKVSDEVKSQSVKSGEVTKNGAKVADGWENPECAYFAEGSPQRFPPAPVVRVSLINGEPQRME